MSMFGSIVYKDGEFIDNSWIKWVHWGVPDEENGARELIRNVLALLFHCLNCTSLSGCYFAADNKPEKHPNCDCSQYSITKPYNEAKANCDVRKLRNIFLTKNIRTMAKLSYLACWDF